MRATLLVVLVLVAMLFAKLGQHDVVEVAEADTHEITGLIARLAAKPDPRGPFYHKFVRDMMD